MFYIVLSVVVIMGIFILFYHTFSRQLAFSSFYHVNRDKLRNVTDVILDSSFNYLQKETSDSTSSLSKKIVDIMADRTTDRTLPLVAPLFEEYKDSLLQGAKLEYKVEGNVFDRRTSNQRGHSYHKGEGLGTVEIALKAALKTPGGKTLASCKRVRHFDFKSACIVSSYKTRENSYAMSFPLDYSILVRDGLREFKDGYRGLRYNSGKKIELADQSSIPEGKRGWVYFGKADVNDNNSRIFLNVSNEMNSMDAILPALGVSSFEIGHEECMQLLSIVENGFTLENLKGKFTAYIVPAARTSGDMKPKEEDARSILSMVPGGKKTEQKPAFLDVKGPVSKSYLESIFRGAINQKFMYMVHFKLDTSSAIAKAGGKTVPIYSITQARLKLEVAGNFICFSPDDPFFTDSANQSLPGFGLLLDNMRKVKSLADTKSPPISLYSSMNEKHMIYSGQTYSESPSADIFGVKPKFFSRNGSQLSDLTLTGGDGFRPFRHCTLYSSRFIKLKDFEDSPIYDKKEGILNLRGIHSIEFDHLTLKAPAGKKFITVRGRGALLVPNGFTIQCGIKLEDPDKDLCILFTRAGSIRVATSEKIEAALLAFNDSNSASIFPSNPLNVKGCIGVDKLYLDRYPLTAGVIEYDPRFKAESANDEIFTVNLSPWIRFDDINFAKEG